MLNLHPLALSVGTQACLLDAHRFTQVHVINLVWAFANRRHVHLPFQRWACEFVESRAAEFEPRNLSRFVVSMSTLRYSHVGGFRAVAQVALEKLDEIELCH